MGAYCSRYVNGWPITDAGPVRGDPPRRTLTVYFLHECGRYPFVAPGPRRRSRSARRGPTPVALERNRPSSAAISTCRSARVTSSRPRSAAAPWATSTSTAPGDFLGSRRYPSTLFPSRVSRITTPEGWTHGACPQAAAPACSTPGPVPRSRPSLRRRSPSRDGPRASLAPGAATAEPVRARQPRRGASWADVPGGVALESAPVARSLPDDSGALRHAPARHLSTACRRRPSAGDQPDHRRRPTRSLGGGERRVR